MSQKSPLINPSRREFLGPVAAVAGLSLGSAGCGPSNNRPNILWMIAEDFCPDLGCYGNDLVASPNLDGLAAEGVRFTNTFMTAPVCSAARSALATGMYQTTIGAHNHRSHRGDGYHLPDGVHVFTHYLRQRGYHTSNLKGIKGIGGTGKTDFNFNVVEPPYDGTDWTQRQPDQPFYAQINFLETHRAFHRCPEHPIDPSRVKLPPYYPDHPAVRLDWAAYLETAENLDAKVGKVIQRLKDQNLWEDTIVFFFADHGRPMPRGKQFLYDGGIHIPLLVRVPKRFQVGGYAAGTVNNNLVSSIDITATTLRLAGIDPPAHMEGLPFFGPGVRPRTHIIAARDRCDETVDRIRCVRNQHYAYIKNFFPDRPYTQQNVYKDANYPPLQVMRDLKTEGKLTGPPALFLASNRPPEELYDLKADPDEIHNLAGDPAAAPKLKEMRAILDDWIRSTGDKGAILENHVMEWDADRTENDGWCTRWDCKATKTNGKLVVERLGTMKNGKPDLARSIVEKGEEMVIAFRARSKDATIETLQWGVIGNMRDRKNRVPIHFKADGKWREYTVPFRTGGYLGRVAFLLGKDEGTIEFDWIRISRKENGRLRKLRQWDFA